MRPGCAQHLPMAMPKEASGEVSGHNPRLCEVDSASRFPSLSALSEQPRIVDHLVRSGCLVRNKQAVLARASLSNLFSHQLWSYDMWRGRMARVAELADAHVADDWLSAAFCDMIAEWQAQLQSLTATTQKTIGCLPGCS